MDQNKAEQLLINVSPEMPIWQWFHTDKSCRKVYQDSNGRPLALLIYTVNTFHPHALGITVFAPFSIPSLFQTILTDAIKEAEKRHKDRLVTWEYQLLSTFTNWLLTQGFTVWRETVMPKSRLTDVSLPPIDIGNAEVITTSEIQTNDDLRTQLINISLADYRKTHVINPMAKTSPAQWHKIVFPDTLSDAPLVLIREKRITAYTFPFEDKPKMFTFGWLGASNLEDLWILQAAQITWAKQRGMYDLAGEFDNTDPSAWAVLHHWPFPPAPVYAMVGMKLAFD